MPISTNGTRKAVMQPSPFPVPHPVMQVTRKTETMPFQNRAKMIAKIRRPMRELEVFSFAGPARGGRVRRRLGLRLIDEDAEETARADEREDQRDEPEEDVAGESALDHGIGGVAPVDVADGLLARG